MSKIGIFYGSSTGTTENVARQIGARLGLDAEDIHNIDSSKPSDVEKYDVIILGSSTWGSGELQDSWYNFLPGIESLDLSGKKIAIFGCGDETMSDTFNDAAGEIYDSLQSTGATFIGKFDVGPYEFNSSKAVKDGVAIGLLLDEDNRPEVTDIRIKGWTSQLEKEI